MLKYKDFPICFSDDPRIFHNPAFQSLIEEVKRLIKENGDPKIVLVDIYPGETFKMHVYLGEMEENEEVKDQVFCDYQDKDLYLHIRNQVYENFGFLAPMPCENTSPVGFFGQFLPVIHRVPKNFNSNEMEYWKQVYLALPLIANQVKLEIMKQKMVENAQAEVTEEMSTL